MADNDVRMVYTKYDGSLHWNFTMRRLGDDEHGVWLGAGAGLESRRGYEPPVVIKEPHVILVPTGTWYTANFLAAPNKTEIYCDICTPPRWLGPGEVTMADLDLDVIRRRVDQQVLLLDEDEFAEHQVRYAYPADVIAAAEQSAAALQDTISGGAEPFAGAYHAWLDQVR